MFLKKTNVLCAKTIKIASEENNELIREKFENHLSEKELSSFVK